VATAIRDADRWSGLRLRAWLDARPPRPVEIAREAGVSKQYISEILAGRCRPSARVVDACERLGLPVDLLFFGVDVDESDEVA
jgi:transcriptional regulator with XRE-family HTH domain